MRCVQFIFFLSLFFCSFLVQAQKFDLNDKYIKIEQALQKDPDNLSLLMDKAYLFSQGLEFDRALALYQKVLQKDPKNKRAVNELCVLYTQMGQKEQAKQFCEKMVALSPESHLSHDNLGLSYFKLGEYQKALKPFVTALILQPESHLIRYHIVQVFMALEEFSLAEAHLLELAKDQKASLQTQALVHHGLYLVQTRLKKYDLAYASIKKTYDLSQNSLFFGKMISAYVRAHQVLSFFVASLALLGLCHYLGKRLNRFLKNEKTEVEAK